MGFVPFVNQGGLLSSRVFLGASQSGTVEFTVDAEDLGGGCFAGWYDSATAFGTMSVDRFTGVVSGQMGCHSVGSSTDPCLAGHDHDDYFYYDRFDDSCVGSPIPIPDNATFFSVGTGAYSGEITLSMSSEFTDAMLFEDHPVPEFEGDLVESFYTQPIAQYFMNGITLRRAAVEYQFAFPVPGNGVCYRIKWNECARVLKSDGTWDLASPPVYTPRSYQWDYSWPDDYDPDDYDPDDIDTWPRTPAYLLEIPTTNSTIQIVDQGSFSPVLEDLDVENNPDRVTYSCERCT